jgi:hypothetical protein
LFGRRPIVVLGDGRLEGFANAGSSVGIILDHRLDAHVRDAEIVGGQPIAMSRGLMVPLLGAGGNVG